MRPSDIVDGALNGTASVNNARSLALLDEADIIKEVSAPRRQAILNDPLLLEFFLLAHDYGPWHCWETEALRHGVDGRFVSQLARACACAIRRHLVVDRKRGPVSEV